MNTSLGKFDELMELEKNNSVVLFQLNENGETINAKLLLSKDRKNTKKREITDKVKYTYGPEHWYISGYFDEGATPKEIYNTINPKNELCQFSIGCGSKTYKFFHNILNGKRYRHYTVVECVSYEF